MNDFRVLPPSRFSRPGHILGAEDGKLEVLPQTSALPALQLDSCIPTFDREHENKSVRTWMSRL